LLLDGVGKLKSFSSIIYIIVYQKPPENISRLRFIHTVEKGFGGFKLMFFRMWQLGGKI
jgi:hypothetical protein